MFSLQSANNAAEFDADKTAINFADLESNHSTFITSINAAYSCAI